MKIEAVITCLNYADFLHHTLPFTQAFVDDLVVVTTDLDKETQDVCRHHGARCYETKAFDIYGGPFNKGSAINEGLNQLRRDDWLLVLDADIVVPPHVRPFVEDYPKDTESIYGVDRRSCEGVEALRKADFVNLPMMPRVSIFGATPPPGYFQLWHSSMVPCGPWYEDTYRFADRTDMTFAQRFPRRKYLKTWAVHLDEGDHVGGTNWRGRKSPRFVSEDEVRLDLGS